MLTAFERRKKIMELLRETETPTSAASLAEKFDVSRQVIVGDIALIRASGCGILSTPRGYILDNPRRNEDFGYIGILACVHTPDQLAEELYTMVDYGGTVIDVTIDHPIYGQISGALNLRSRYDIDLFIDKTKNGNGQLLSKLTGGVHLHKIGCPNEETFLLIKDALLSKGIALS